MRISEEEPSTIENSTHSNVCDTCSKAINMSGNPAAVMRQCKWSGAVVSKHQVCCEAYKPK